MIRRFFSLKTTRVHRENCPPALGHAAFLCLPLVIRPIRKLAAPFSLIFRLSTIAAVIAATQTGCMFVQ
jgi:hypothetical protein